MWECGNVVVGVSILECGCGSVRVWMLECGCVSVGGSVCVGKGCRDRTEVV